MTFVASVVDCARADAAGRDQRGTCDADSVVSLWTCVRTVCYSCGWPGYRFRATGARRRMDCDGSHDRWRGYLRFRPLQNSLQLYPWTQPNADSRYLYRQLFPIPHHAQSQARFAVHWFGNYYHQRADHVYPHVGSQWHAAGRSGAV